MAVTRNKVRRYHPGQQLPLFDTLTPDQPLAKKDNAEPADDDDPAYVYIATFGGGGRVIWKTTVKDAKTICQLPQSKGTLWGNAWMYCWTSENNFGEYGGDFEHKEKQHRQKDDGRFAQIFEEMGIKVTPI